MTKKETDSNQRKHFEDQLDDEEVLYVFRKHPIVMRKGLIIAMATWLVGPVYTMVLTYVRPDNYPSLTFFFASLAISIVAGVIIMLPYWITWYFSVYIITDKRLLQISQKGLWSKSVVDIGLNQIQMVNYQVAGFNETVLGFGTISMQTFVGDLVIHEVHHPEKIQRKILEILREKGIVLNSPPQLGDNQDTNEE